LPAGLQARNRPPRLKPALEKEETDMTWNWLSPTRFFFGSGAIADKYEEMKTLGKRALIVTGKGGSAVRNGSLRDLCRALSDCDISWDIFREVEANPSVETVRRGAAIARETKTEFVVGLGGGSPLDAAKAIAVLAVNDITDEEMFAARFTAALPLVAIPTTAGTGSEVTPYSILTYPAIDSKKSIFSPVIIPVLAYIDPEYTRDIPLNITVDTAVDAYSHALEGYLAVKSNPISDLIAREALRISGTELKLLTSGTSPGRASREALLYASTLAGLVISQTGTSIPHAMGYPLTYFKGIPHGRANGILMPAYLAFTLRNGDNPKVMEALQCSGFSSLQEFKKLMRDLCGPAPECSDNEQTRFIEICSQAKNLSNHIVRPSRQDLESMLQESL